MAQWKYKIVDVAEEAVTGAGLEEVLAAYGMEGWELVQVLSTATPGATATPRLILKTEKAMD